MPSPMSLDPSVAEWLAELDPTLSLLPRALPAPASSQAWLLHDVRWTPGEGCRLTYQVRSPRSAVTFVAVDVTSTGWSRRDYREDPRLPRLAWAADPAHAIELLGSLTPAPVTQCRVEPVRYRPGSRCVLRYDVETAADGVTLFGKAFRADDFTHVATLGTSIAASHDGAPLVAEVTAVWPELRVVVGKAVTGRPVSAVLGDSAVAARQRAGLAHRLGDFLAQFHAQTAPTSRRWSAADQIAAVAGSVAAARCADARLGHRLQHALDVLAADLPPAGPVVLGHGAFRAGQVILTGDDRLVVLDLDGVCRCDAGRDVGTVLAHLRWQSLRQPQQRRTLRAAEHALLAGYQTRAGEVDPQALLWWRAAALLQVAVRRFRRLEVTAWPLVPELADAADALLAVPARRQAPVARDGATDLLDRRQMSLVLRRALAPIAANPHAVEVDTAEELSTASGRRSVVRYTVRGLDAAEPASVVGKVFTELRRARLLHEHLGLLSAGPFGTGPLRVPQPLGLLAEQRLVIYRAGDGEPLDRLLERGRAEDAVRQAALWLARLHTCEVRLPRRFSLSQEEESTKRWAALIGQVHPAVAGQAQWLASRWLVAARSAVGGQDVPMHKDFHAGHVLVGDGVCVLDLDEARQGDPAFDVAHFCAYLELADSSVESVLRSVFLTEYANSTGWHDDESYAAFAGYSWLKIAKQWAVGSGPGRGASATRRRTGMEHALAKGEACLSG